MNENTKNLILLSLKSIKQIRIRFLRSSFINLEFRFLWIISLFLLYSTLTQMTVALALQVLTFMALIADFKLKMALIFALILTFSALAIWNIQLRIKSLYCWPNIFECSNDIWHSQTHVLNYIENRLY